jgi:hypothetical protein
MGSGRTAAAERTHTKRRKRRTGLSTPVRFFWRADEHCVHIRMCVCIPLICPRGKSTMLLDGNEAAAVAVESLKVVSQ